MDKFDDLKGRTAYTAPLLDFFKNIAMWGKKKHLYIFFLILAMKLVRCHQDCRTEIPWLVKVKSAAETPSILAWRNSSRNKYIGAEGNYTLFCCFLKMWYPVSSGCNKATALLKCFAVELHAVGVSELLSLKEY